MAQALAMLIWSAMSFGVTAPAAAPARLDLVVTTDKASYTVGESVVVDLQITNHARERVVLAFPTGQRYDVFIEDTAGRVVWRWSDGRVFAQVLGEEALDPGHRLRYRVSVRATLPPARYQVKAIVPAERQPLSSATTIEVES